MRCPLPALVALCLGLSTLRAEDWPRFLGPRQDNTVVEAGLNLDWPPEGPPVLWRAEVGNAYSPPVVVAGLVLAFHREGGEEALTAHRVADGSRAWRAAYPSRYEDQYGYNNGPRGSPFVQEGRVFTFGAEGVMACWKLTDGSLVWRRNLMEEYRAEPNFFGNGPSPVVADGVLLMNIGGTRAGTLLGLDPASGRTLWTATEDGQSYATPVVADLAGRRTAVFVTRNQVVALDSQTGKIFFQTPFVSRIHESVNAASPVIAGDEVFLSATYGVGGLLLRARAEGPWETVWRDARAMENHWATAIKVGDHLYGMHGRHESGSSFRCLEWATGRVVWDAPRGLGRATFVRVRDHFIALGERGDLALIEISPVEYREKRRLRVLPYPCWTPPVISDGRLYLRNERTLVCYDLRAPAP
jgi:outer membrane protein assembly factor BamB